MTTNETKYVQELEIEKQKLVQHLESSQFSERVLLQERDTLKKENEFLLGKIDQIEIEHREVSNKRDTLREANKELIEALEITKNVAISWGSSLGIKAEYTRTIMESEALILKHRKGE